MAPRWDLPPPYHSATIEKHFPGQCREIQKRFREFYEASIQQRQAKKVAEFRQIAYQLHEQGTELLVNRVLKRMSPPRSLDYRIACAALAEIQREIQAMKPLGRPCGKMTEQSTSPDALRAQTE